MFLLLFTDAMAIVRKYGKPDLFITFTASADWPEIKESLRKEENSFNRPDVVSRVFEMKVHELIKDIEHGGVLGRLIAILVIKEWQKRGLPHVHILIILHPDDKPRSPQDIDKIVCAEFPDESVNPLLHKLVKDKMIHGPCDTPISPCKTKNKNQCDKNYPKFYHEETTTSETGITIYRRRHADDGGHTASKLVKGQIRTIGNTWVVPYNPYLLLKYKAHINVEVCTSVSSVKYLYKYVLKGADKISFQVSEGESSEKVKDEVNQYEQGRYYDSTQSADRIFEFEMCHRYPAVMKLQLHLENEQVVIFNEDDNAPEVLERFSKTQLTEYFQLNKTDPDARQILYPDIPGERSDLSIPILFLNSAVYIFFG